MAVPFDTHTFITDLTRAGMPESQATVLSDTLQQVYRDHAVTTQDLDLAVAHLDTRFATSDTQLATRCAQVDTRFATLEGQLTHLRSLGYAIFAATVVTFFVNEPLCPCGGERTSRCPPNSSICCGRCSTFSSPPLCSWRASTATRSTAPS